MEINDLDDFDELDDSTEEELHIPLYINISYVNEDIEESIKYKLETIVYEHNKKQVHKIEGFKNLVVVRYVDEDDEVWEDLSDKPEDSYKIKVGDTIVQSGIIPSCVSNDYEKQQLFYDSLFQLFESTLIIWHDRIIEVQEENEKKIEKYEKEEKYEILYDYFSECSSKRAFRYIKKLAYRYPNSHWATSLKDSYYSGFYGRRINYTIAKKLREKRAHHIKESF